MLGAQQRIALNFLTGRHCGQSRETLESGFLSTRPVLQAPSQIGSVIMDPHAPQSEMYDSPEQPLASHESDRHVRCAGQATSS